MQIDTSNRLSFTLKFKNSSYIVIADPLMKKQGQLLLHDGRYIVEIKDDSGKNYNMIFNLSTNTGEWVTYFKSDLHPSIINNISDAISNLTM